MEERPLEEEGADESGGIAPYYTGICMVALVLMAVALDSLLGSTSRFVQLIPIGVGAVALRFQLGTGPLLLLALVSGLLFAGSPRELVAVSSGSPRVLAWLFGYRLLLAASSLAFTIAYWRLLSLETEIFPPDRRKKSAVNLLQKSSSDHQSARAAQSTSSAELVSMVFALAFSTLAGYLIWLGLDRLSAPVELQIGEDAPQWRLLVVACAIVIIGVCGGVAVGFLNRATATPRQNLLYLQDQLWRETRSDQGRVNRWLARARMKMRRKKEKP
jgi:hypothetical protein